MTLSLRWRRRIVAVVGGLLLSSLLAVSTASFVDASGYDNTNPATTPCGDGSHPVITWRYFYIQSGSLTYARVEIRRSDFCNTVWTRVTNLTGSGSGYATARSITADERMAVYTCPVTASCLLHSETELGDVLPTTGSTGFSFQWVIPAGTTRGSPPAKQPPGMDGYGAIHFGSTTLSLDTNMEPVYTSDYADFHNELPLRTDAHLLSCDNDAAHVPTGVCVTAGETAGASRTLLYYLDPSLSTTPGSANLISDIETQILPAWSHKTTHSPVLTYCVTGDRSCQDSSTDEVRLGTSAELGNNYAQTESTTNGLVPATFTYSTIVLKNQTYNHTCSNVDSGCVPADDRMLIAHELGHTLGFGHCDLAYTAMCHVIATLSTEWDTNDGVSFWGPQSSEVLGLKAMYP